MFKEISGSLSKYSSNTAYVFYGSDDQTITRTYEQLNQEIEQIKCIFREVPQGVLIGVQLGKSPCLLPVIYCLLEIKAAFLLLDDIFNDNYPTSNINIYGILQCQHKSKKSMCQRFKIDKCITLSTNFGCLLEFSTITKNSIEDIENSRLYNGIIYVITTSGTLGKQKVVKVTEESIHLNIKSFIKLFDITTNDVIYFGTPLSFDPALVELFLAFTTGACLLTVDQQIQHNPQKLLHCLFQDHKINKHVTFLQMCPSVFLQFTEEQQNFIFSESTLKTLGLGGEQFPVHILPEKVSKSCRIYNFYGITEVSCWASVEEVLPTANNEVTIGTPFEDTFFQIDTLDGNVVNLWEKQLELNEFECEGVLKIGSKGRICYVDDEIIGSKPDNFIFRCTGDLVQYKNGKVFYKGRTNDIIKRYGHRISLLKMQDLIFQATQLNNQCLYYKDQIFCFLQIYMKQKTTDEFRVKTLDKIRIKIIKSLTPEFVPDLYDILIKFPIKESNGKINKLSLEQYADKLLLNAAKKSLDYDQKKCKCIYLTLLCKYLGFSLENLEYMKFKDLNFWETGGTSIIAMQLVQEFENITNIALSRELLDLKLGDALCFLDLDVAVYKDNSTNRNIERVFNVVWKENINACIDTTSIVGLINGTSYIAVGNFAHTFSVFHSLTGKLTASIYLPNVIESASLLVEDKFYVPCFDGKLYCLQLILEYEHQAKLDVLWYFKTEDRLKNKPILVGDKIVFGSYDKFVYALNMAGILFWKTLITEPVTAEIKHFNGLLYIGGLKGKIMSISSESGDILWSYTAQNPIFTSPEISKAHNCIIFADIGGNMYCFSLGIAFQLTWKFTTNDSVESLQTFGLMLLNDKRIFLGTQNGKLNIYHFNNSSCQLTEAITLNSKASVTTKPLLLNIKNKNYLVIVSSAGLIQLFIINTAKENSILSPIGSFPLRSDCFSSPQNDIIHNNRFYLGCRDNNLYCFEVIVN